MGVHDGTDLWLTALRPLQPGEPVTTSYLNLEGLCQSYKDRQANLQEWGFTCACTRCSSEAAQSDAPSPPPRTALFKLCQSPPDIQDLDTLPAYCKALRQLRTMAAKLFRGAANPTSCS